MDYLFTFLEGVASFISPCILPMLPIYISYLMGSDNRKKVVKKDDDSEVEEEKVKVNEIKTDTGKINIIVGKKPHEETPEEIERNTKKGITNALGFVLGFTITFVILSVIASLLGNALNFDSQIAKVILGIVIIFIGIGYMGILPIHFKVLDKLHMNVQKFSFLNFATSILFGIVVSVSWIPCVGPFLSSSLLLISQETNILKGIALILIYSLGLGIPFMISAFLMEKLKNTFKFIKNNYNVVKIICGIILIIMGGYVIFK